VAFLTPATSDNPWFSLDYVTRSWNDLLAALGEHLFITVAAIGLSTAAAIPLAVLAVRTRWLVTPLLAVSSLLYTIPALALITGLWPVFGLTATTVIVALAAYALLVIVRNAVVGIQGVPEHVLAAARGMGYRESQLVWRVSLPIALPAVMAGIRVATVSTVGLVMIGALVGHGGLGTIVLNGFTTNFYRAPIVMGIVLTVVLALVLELLLVGLQRLLTPWEARRAT
jgi:osmoprotectant transport system permease protein